MSLLHAILIIFADVVSVSSGGDPQKLELAPVISPSSIAKQVSVDRSKESLAVLRGWNYLVQLLVDDGLEENLVRSIYHDPRMPKFTKILFALKPKEGAHMYSDVRTKNSVLLAKRCLNKHLGHFQGAQKEFAVPKEILASLIYVESRCGEFTGKSPIIHRLSRLAAVGESENLLYNYNLHRKADPTVTFGETVERASYLERTFFPQIKALIQLAALQNENVFGFRGSPAGAFGLPQFLPTKYFEYGIDGDGDSQVSLYKPADAIWSAANYLSSNGYDAAQPPAQNRKAIWSYNHSDAYIDAVIYIAERL